ncbi:MAG TPA: hypothetical protein VNQ73_10615 [Ilumatobacter sp.]|nr:hypothetical protein [Ilumatobacter sp.]
MSVLSSAMLAVGWEPELRGALTVLIGLAVWMGSVYLIVATNVGARLGLLVSLAALMGWMALMGGIWWIYGIGLEGDLPSWKQVEGRTVVQEVRLLHDAGVLDQQISVTGDAPADAAAVAAQLDTQGWERLDTSAPEYGQAQSAAEGFLIAEGAFSAGQYAVTAVYEVDPPHESAYPKIFGRSELDFIAFWHKPYYTLVEVAPYTPVFTEAGRAPVAPRVDESAPRQYVYMIRDLGSERQPAAMITIGSTAAFLALCWLLHRRDQFVAENLARKAAAPATA